MDKKISAVVLTVALLTTLTGVGAYQYQQYLINEASNVQIIDSNVTISGNSNVTIATAPPNPNVTVTSTPSPAPTPEKTIQPTNQPVYTQQPSYIVTPTVEPTPTVTEAPNFIMTITYWEQNRTVTNETTTITLGIKIDNVQSEKTIYFYSFYIADPNGTKLAENTSPYRINSYKATINSIYFNGNSNNMRFTVNGTLGDYVLRYPDAEINWVKN